MTSQVEWPLIFTYLFACPRKGLLLPLSEMTSSFEQKLSEIKATYNAAFMYDARIERTEVLNSPVHKGNLSIRPLFLGTLHLQKGGRLTTVPYFLVEEAPFLNLSHMENVAYTLMACWGYTTKEIGTQVTIGVISQSDRVSYMTGPVIDLGPILSMVEQGITWPRPGSWCKNCHLCSKVIYRQLS